MNWKSSEKLLEPIRLKMSAILIRFRMDNEKRSPIDRLLFATFLKGRTSSRDLLDEKGEMTPEDNQKILNETNEIINDDSTYPFISYLSDLLTKSKPSDAAVKQLHSLIDQINNFMGLTSDWEMAQIEKALKCSLALDQENLVKSDSQTA